MESGPSSGAVGRASRWLVVGIVAGCLGWALLGRSPQPRAFEANPWRDGLLVGLLGGEEAVYAVVSRRGGPIEALSERSLPAGPLVTTGPQAQILVPDGAVGLRVLAGRAGESAPGRLERDRYVEVSWSGMPVAAAAGDEDAWVAVSTGEALDVVRFDGRRVGARARVADLAPEDVALAVEARDRVRVALLSGGSVREVRVAGGDEPTVETLGSFEPQEGRALAARYLRSRSGETHLVALVRAGREHRLVRVAPGAAGGGVAASFGEARSVRVLGVEPRQEGDLLVLRADGVTHGFDEEDGVRREPRPWLAAWSARRPRFLGPFLSLLVALGLGGAILGRRRRGWVWVGKGGREQPVRVVFPRSPLWRRLAAFLLDAAMLLTAGAALAWSRLGADELRYLEETWRAGAAWARDPVATALASDASLLAMGCLIGYAAVCETFFGATLGKRALGLRVLGLLGQPIGPGEAAARAAFLFVDVFLTQGWLGLLLVVLTPRRRRLGDLFAGTQVVYFRSPVRPSIEPLDPAAGERP